MGYPAKTTEGETVTIVDKLTVAGDAPTLSQVLVSEDGRQFSNVVGRSGIVQEILDEEQPQNGGSAEASEDS